jgi:orotate phosphoribosyltransferase
VDVVVGEGTGGAVLAWETARQLGVRATFAEEVSEPGGGALRVFGRGVRIEPGERALLVEAVLRRRESVLPMLAAVEARGGEIVGCHVLVDRSAEERSTIASPSTGRSYPLRALWRLGLATFEPGPETCPRCAAGDPIAAPEISPGAAAGI